jgi:glycyl-tRNA synthetase beta chain
MSAKRAADADATADLLVEIGCEELPPKALARLAHDFALLLHSGLGDAHLVPGLELGGKGAISARYYNSPRRLAVLVPGVLTQQPDRMDPLTGPAEKVAFDAAGKPTKAAEGFAAKCGTTVDKLGRKDGKLFYERKLAGRAAAEVVPEALRAALDALPIAKRMRWGAGDAQFVRPVHWIVLLLGDLAIATELYGVTSGHETRGHRFHHPQPIVLKSAADYVAKLKSAKVLLNDADHAVEREILRQAEAKAAAAGGALLPKATRIGGLVSEVAALCEWPVVLEGRFDARYLDLPPEVLVSTIEGNQRYLLLAGPDGRLLPKFLFVANIESKDPAEVVRGNERVIVPRLSDAEFFWRQDRGKRLADRSPGLAGVVFQKDLGSYAAKAERVAAAAASFAGALGADPTLVARAAALAKCDLLTSLVGEYPELQGTIGRALAKQDGEPPEVAAAIEEQYLPRFAGDALPRTKTGQALALAEKLDTVCGIFAIGQKPTGDKDPFALRRAALGAMRIAIELKLPLNLVDAVDATYRRHKPGATAAETMAVYGFFSERMRAYYAERGIRGDVFDAIEKDAFRDPPHADARLKAVQEFLALPEAASLAAANKRIANILEQAEAKGLALAPRIDPARLEPGAERALYDVLESGEVEWIRGLIDQHAYDTALRKLAALKAPVDAFFDGVMVMVDDAPLRANRLALLARVRALFTQIADIGRLQVEP